MERLKLLKHKLSDHWQEIVALAEEDQKYVSLPQQLQMLPGPCCPLAYDSSRTLSDLVF